MHITSYKKCVELSRQAHYAADPLVELGFLDFRYEGLSVYGRTKTISGKYEITLTDEWYKEYSFVYAGTEEWSTDDECRAKEFLNNLLAFRESVENKSMVAWKQADNILKKLKE